MYRKEIDIHLNALAGFINDEDNLVTYKRLSKELGIHVNLSKQILFEYWDNRCKEKKGSITATFLLMGYLQNGEMRIEVVREADLPSAKKKFSKIISEHIYSLQKTLPDIELLAFTDKGDPQQSAVRCVESVIRSEYEMEVLRWGSSLALNKTVKNVPSVTSRIQKQSDVETKPLERTHNVSKESMAKVTASKPAKKSQKNGFNNLFAEAVDKQNKDKAAGSTSFDNKKSKGNAGKNCPPENAWFEASKKSSKNGKEQPGSSNEFVDLTVDGKTSKDLANSDEKRNKTSVDSDDSEFSSPKKNAWFEATKKPKSKENQPENRNRSIESVAKNKKKEELYESKNTRKKESPKKNIGSGISGGKKMAATKSRGKKRQSSTKNEGISQKRKRIVVIESSEEYSSSEMEDIMESDNPEEQQVVEKIRSCPSPPLVKCEGGQRKVLRLVDKTFMDEDGYFVTKKEYVYESCSDKEDKVQVQIIKPTTQEPVVKNTNKRKQATLLNFFKKS